MLELNSIRNEINEIDKEMAKLFEKRMKLAKNVALYKKKYSLPIEDLEREQQLLNKNLEYIKNEKIKMYYTQYLENLMNISKEYQKEIITKED